MDYLQPRQNPSVLFPPLLLLSDYTQDQVPEALLMLNDICTCTQTHTQDKSHACTIVWVDT